MTGNPHFTLHMSMPFSCMLQFDIVVFNPIYPYVVPSLCTIDLNGVTEQDELPLPIAVAESGIGKWRIQIKFSEMYTIILL